MVEIRYTIVREKNKKRRRKEGYFDKAISFEAYYHYFPASLSEQLNINIILLLIILNDLNILQVRSHCDCMVHVARVSQI